jgi:hypothetical protein
LVSEFITSVISDLVVWIVVLGVFAAVSLMSYVSMSSESRASRFLPRRFGPRTDVPLMSKTELLRSGRFFLTSAGIGSFTVGALAVAFRLFRVDDRGFVPHAAFLICFFFLVPLSLICLVEGFYLTVRGLCSRRV